MTDTAVRVAFVCGQNAGRSQLATTGAEHERERRDLDRVREIRDESRDRVRALFDEIDQGVTTSA